MSKDASYARGHKETSITGKWDPGGYDLNQMRADTAKKLTPPPEPTPPPIPVEDDEMPVLWASDGAGPDTVIYAIPLDLSYKVPVDKTSYDAINAKAKGYYIRVDISAGQLAAIPLVQTDGLYLTADGDPGTYIAPPDLSHKVHITDSATKNALDQTKITGKGRYDEVKISKVMLDNIPTVGKQP